MAQDQNLAWVEKYRPQTLNDVILPQRIKDKFKDGLYSNFLLFGSQGIGKTTLARILARGRTWKQINASLDSGIDTVRDTIMNYCSAASLTGDGKKVLILDEADSLTVKSQDALRGTIELFVRNSYFIFTCNYPERLTPPMRSRFEMVDMNFSAEEDQEQIRGYYKRIYEICKIEGVALEKEGLIELVKKSYPDFRQIIQNLQGIAKTSNRVDLDSVKNFSAGKTDVELYEFIVKEFEPAKVYAFVKGRYMNKEIEAYSALGDSFLNWLVENNRHDKVGRVAAAVHKYSFESNGVNDKLVSLTACVFELTQIFK